MEFHSIFISNPAHLFLRNKQLVIRQDRERTVPLEDITSILIESRAVTMTSAVLQAMTDNKITVYFCDEKHMPATISLPLNQNGRQLKLLHGQFGMKTSTTNRIWQDVISKKIENQAKCLSILGRKEAGTLFALSDSVRLGDKGNLEAQAAAIYFRALFGEDFSRSLDTKTNAALNYGYAIIRGAVARCVVCHGLEPCLGVFHHNELNRFNLVDDLMEPFRPLVDLFVATFVDDSDESLSSECKHQLFNLTNYVVSYRKKRYRTISAIDQMVQSYVRIVLDGRSELDLPDLQPLESYSHE